MPDLDTVLARLLRLMRSLQVDTLELGGWGEYGGSRYTAPYFNSISYTISSGSQILANESDPGIALYLAITASKQADAALTVELGPQVRATITDRGGLLEDAFLDRAFDESEKRRWRQIVTDASSAHGQLQIFRRASERDSDLE